MKEKKEKKKEKKNKKKRKKKNKQINLFFEFRTIRSKVSQTVRNSIFKFRYSLISII